jgi:transcriptional regulator with XRE-family HTH domain
MDLGMSQEELGERIGYGQNMVARVELGQRRLTVLEFLALARALRLDPTQFFLDAVVAPNKSDPILGETGRD